MRLHRRLHAIKHPASVGALLSSCERGAMRLLSLVIQESRAIPRPPPPKGVVARVCRPSSSRAPSRLSPWGCSMRLCAYARVRMFARWDGATARGADGEGGPERRQRVWWAVPPLSALKTWEARPFQARPSPVPTPAGSVLVWLRLTAALVLACCSRRGLPAASVACRAARLRPLESSAGFRASQALLGRCRAAAMVSACDA